MLQLPVQETHFESGKTPQLPARETDFESGKAPQLPVQEVDFESGKAPQLPARETHIESGKAPQLPARETHIESGKAPPPLVEETHFWAEGEGDNTAQLVPAEAGQQLTPSSGARPKLKPSQGRIIPIMVETSKVKTEEIMNNRNTHYVQVSSICFFVTDVKTK